MTNTNDNTQSNTEQAETKPSRRGSKSTHTKQELIELIRQEIQKGNKINRRQFGSYGDKRHWFAKYGGIEAFVDDVPELLPYIQKIRKQRQLFTKQECIALFLKMIDEKGKNYFKTKEYRTEEKLFIASIRKHNLSIKTLSEQLGLTHVIRPNGYYQDFEIAKQTLLKLIEDHPEEVISQDWLINHGYSGLVGAIARFFGGFIAFRKQIGSPIYREANSGLTLEDVKAKLKALFEEHGANTVTQTWLQENGYTTYVTLIGNTEGVTFISLRKELGFEYVTKWGSPESTLNSFRSLIETHGLKALNARYLRKIGLSNAGTAAARFFGGMAGLREALGHGNLKVRGIY